MSEMNEEATVSTPEAPVKPVKPAKPAKPAKADPEPKAVPKGLKGAKGAVKPPKPEPAVPVERAKRTPSTPTAKLSPKPNHDLIKKYKSAAITFKQMGDATRVAILDMLNDSEKYVGEICMQLSQSQPAVSHHLALLRHGRLIEPRREGKQNFYSLTDVGQKAADMIRAHTED